MYLNEHQLRLTKRNLGLPDDGVIELTGLTLDLTVHRFLDRYGRYCSTDPDSWPLAKRPAEIEAGSTDA